MTEVKSGIFDKFPDEVQDDLDGLIFLGHLQDTVRFCGHTFVLRTLRAQEELQVGRLTKEYLETFGQPLSFASAVVALSLVSVDGFEDFATPLGPSAADYANVRFNFVTENWYRTTIEFLFDECEKLRLRQIATVEAMQDLSPRSQPSFSPSPDSLIVPADYPKPTEDIREFLTD